MNTEEFIKVGDKDPNHSCTDCYFVNSEEPYCFTELIIKLNTLHGKCWRSNHHYELKNKENENDL